MLLGFLTISCNTFHIYNNCACIVNLYIIFIYSLHSSAHCNTLQPTECKCFVAVQALHNYAIILEYMYTVVVFHFLPTEINNSKSIVRKVHKRKQKSQSKYPSCNFPIRRGLAALLQISWSIVEQCDHALFGSVYTAWQ